MQGSYQSLTDAVLPPDGWGDAVVDRHDDSARSVLHTDSIERWLHSRWVSGQPCVWLRPDVLVRVNPGRPRPGLHGATSSLRRVLTPLHVPGQSTALGVACTRSCVKPLYRILCTNQSIVNVIP